MGDAATERSPGVTAEELVERRALLVDVVLEILTRRGYDGVVVREVSRRSRVSSKTIYKLFEHARAHDRRRARAMDGDERLCEGGAARAGRVAL